ncbi:MAG TPA: ATP-binding cassette domain-containing protein [Candidatus Limnocylindrales bacterium]|nr:ATP-binding cassette domain-containing protein [Candidatus Limnocylindrales bacterium]
MTAIEVKDLVKKYDSITAVNGISLEVKPGEFFGFLGPNGAGKTTTIHILCTLLKPTSGSAKVNGYDCITQALQVRSSIGLVFQETTLDRELSVYENLLFNCYLYNLKKKVTEARIDEILEVSGLKDRKHHSIMKLSGGMRRNLDIARGILHRPKILFLDEPTIGLDPQARIHIWDFINKLRKQEAMTVFLTTHYMEEAEKCDRIGIIDHGRLIALGTPAELKRMIKGDVIHLRTTRDLEVEQLIQKQFQLSTKRTPEGIFLEVDSSEAFIPLLFKTFGDQIQAININRPSLNDVFLHLTGREFK